MGLELSKVDKDEKVSIPNENLKNPRFFIYGYIHSGKTTLFKQISKKKYTEEELMNYKGIIYENIFHSMLCVAISFLKSENCPLKNEELTIAKELEDIKENQNFSYLNWAEIYQEKDIYKKIKNLWANPAYQQELENLLYNSNNMMINTNILHFLNKFDQLDPKNYTPTSQDILMAQKVTLGFNQVDIEEEPFMYTIYDYGGRRNERKKWMNIVENKNLIYTINIGDFNKNCIEDEITPYLLESLEIYDVTINNNVFKDIPIFVLLTKYELFKKKIQNQDLKIVFEDYNDGNDEKKALEFIIEKLKNLNKNPSRKLFFYPIDLLDDEQVESFLKDFKSKYETFQGEFAKLDK